MAKVYFIKAKEMVDKLPLMFDKVADEIIKKEYNVALKCHFGEKGNETFVKPYLIKPIIDKLNDLGVKFCLTDANTLYIGPRSESDTHLRLAHEHGFGELGKIVIADQNGESEIPINKKHFKKVYIGKEMEKYDVIIGITHFKGHCATGFGGTIKNIGMGFGTRKGKFAMHAGTVPLVNKERCTACKTCTKHCPADAITVTEYAEIDKEKCIGCAKCIAECPERAIRIPWADASGTQLQERTAEYTLGALKGKKSFFFNYVINITEDCDCIGKPMDLVTEDIGILASIDPIAIDKASYDLVNKQKDFFHESSLDQLKYGEEIGLGKMDYELVEL